MGMCGKVFDEMPVRDVVSWTVVISGFKDAGKFDDALIAFERMRSEGVMTNQVTSVNALAACAGYGALDIGVWIHEHVRRSVWALDVILGTALIDMYGRGMFSSCVHSGFMDVGRRMFSSLVDGKYGCMVDLLARSNCLD
ncbi:hypothetical protein ACS0TY_017043 [Phlomoides rotata]